MKYSRKNHKKFLLQCHLIFSSKYRRKVFNQVVSSFIHNLLDSKEFEEFRMEEIETDEDHIHFMIWYTPDICIHEIVQQMKSYLTFHLWRRFPIMLSKIYWKNRRVFTKGYFVCSIGNSNEETVRKYIQNQG